MYNFSFLWLMASHDSSALLYSGQWNLWTRSHNPVRVRGCGCKATTKGAVKLFWPSRYPGGYAPQLAVQQS